MIFGAHLLVYSEDAVADRAFFRDVFGWATVDAGDGWLIFALPPAEAAVLESRGLQLSEVEEAAWGSVTRFRLPGGARVGIYEPTHPSPIASESLCPSAPTSRRGVLS